MRRLALAAGVVLLLGCRGTVRTGSPGTPLSVLEPADTLRLGANAASLCADGGGLAVLDGSGARLLLLGPDLAAPETIPLTRRLAAPGGIAADRFYFYVYDDNTLYRMLRDELELKPWVANVRVAGLAGYSAGEMLVSDAERDVVWYKTLFGESREFLTASTVPDPGGLAALSEGEFCVLSRSDRLIFFNRAGIETQTRVLGHEYDLVAGNRQGQVYLARRSEPGLRVLAGAQDSEYLLARCGDLQSLAVLENHIAVLDGGSRIVLYRLP